MLKSNFQEVDSRRYGAMWSRSDPKILRASQNGLVASSHRSDRAGTALVFMEIGDKNLVGRLTKKEYAAFTQHLTRCRQPEDIFTEKCGGNLFQDSIAEVGFNPQRQRQSGKVSFI